MATSRRKNKVIIKSPQGDDESPALVKGIFAEKYLYVWLVAFRCVNSLCVQTHFNPDEYWQSLEVAHNMVFGYLLTMIFYFWVLTWEWKEAIRGYLHPFLFAVFYKFLSIFSLDDPWLVIYGPRFFQALLVALGDLFVYKLTKKWFDKSAARWALVCQIFSWFNFYSLIRTYSNSLEAILTIIGLYYWPFPVYDPRKDDKKRTIGLLLGALAFVLRPTSAITWGFLGLYHILNLKSFSEFMKFVFKCAAPVGILVLGFATLLDRYYYGYWVFVPFKFLQVNVLSGVGSFYGTHPFHWYITQGFPAIGFTMLPVGLVGISTCGKDKQGLAYLMLWIITIYSFLAHKEFRFIHTCLLLLHVYSGFALAQLFSTMPSRSNAIVRKWRAIIFGLLLLNIPMAGYFCLFHQRAPIDVMWYINTDLAPKARYPGAINVDFVCGCHSTPFYAYVHNPNITMSFLDCTPNWRDPNYVDETKIFENDPVAFVEERYQIKQRIDPDLEDDASSLPLLPTHVVTFSDKVEQLDPLLKLISYQECKKFSHVPFALSWIVVYCKK